MIFSIESRPRPRVPLLKVAIGTWLLLISLAVVVHHVNLRRVSQTSQDTEIASEVRQLSERLGAVEGQAQNLKQQPAPVSQASFASVRKVLEDRLSQIEQATAAQPSASDLAALATRLEQVETEVKQARLATLPSVAQRRRAAPAKAHAITPPFQLLGIELRAGERFLSIGPTGVSSLSQLRMLRPGEAEASWQLESLEGQTAVFRVGGRVQRLAVP